MASLFLRVSVLRVKPGWETQRVGMRAFDPRTAPRRTSPAACLADAVGSVSNPDMPDALGGSDLPKQHPVRAPSVPKRPANRKY